MKILGAVIAGGQSRRMGGAEKAFVELGGVPLLERVISRIAPQVDEVVINANGDAARFGRFGCRVIADVLDQGTPLAGLHAVLCHAQANGFAAVLTVPSDAPFLPLNLVSRLMDSGAQTGAAVAGSGGQVHHLTGLWSSAMVDPLEKLVIARTVRRMMDLADVFAVETAEWPIAPVDPFMNINTPEDLAAASLLLA
jgi:molybdopterin-guanine dinucleotide biosynthesis protein A